MPGRMTTILLAMQTGGADIVEVCIPFSDPTADGPVIQGTNLTLSLHMGEEKAVANGSIMVDIPPEEALRFRENLICLSHLSDGNYWVVKGFVNSKLLGIIARIRKHTFLPVAVGFDVATRLHCNAAVEAGADDVVVGGCIVSLIKPAPVDQVPQVVENFCRGLKGSSSSNSSTASVQRKFSTDWMTLLSPRFGRFGSQYVGFENHYGYMNHPSKLYFAESLTRYAHCAQLWLKREDLNNTGSHKINNTIGQILLAKCLGKTRIIAETGAGQHGVATVITCACFGMKIVIYMGAEDARRQALKVFHMKMLVPIESSLKTLKDAVNEGQMEASRKLLDVVVTGVGGGSNAIGSFYDFGPDTSVHHIGVKAGGEGINGTRCSAILARGKPGVLHGVQAYVLQDPAGQIVEMHSVSASILGWAVYIVVMDKQPLRGFCLCTQLKGIIPSVHALWEGVCQVRHFPKRQIAFTGTSEGS
ncbi:bifunctional tryptophan synthase TRP1 [Pisolithus microcarpus]|nr:bifunctional tryptophan synthase TRP1 [Pisolithus microcarpus]